MLAAQTQRDEEGNCCCYDGTGCLFFLMIVPVVVRLDIDNTGEEHWQYKTERMQNVFFVVSSSVLSVFGVSFWRQEGGQWCVCLFCACMCVGMCVCCMGGGGGSHCPLPIQQEDMDVTKMNQETAGVLWVGCTGAMKDQLCASRPHLFTILVLISMYTS